MSGRTGVGLAVLLVLGAGIGSPAAAQRLQFMGEAASEVRMFPSGPRLPATGNAELSPSVALIPEFIYQSADGTWRLSGIAFIRLDADDGNRSHLDLRELGLTYLGDGVVGFVGVGKVFWGVTEVHHLVDVVNQTDGVEDIDGEDKLGQPMVSLTLEGSWGSIDLIYLPYFRERTYPAAGARLAGPIPISDNSAYQSDAGKWHQDFAVRWAKPIGSFDLGLSFFRGTSREPVFLPLAGDDGTWALQPRYDIINQLGLDAQWTGDATLLKLEAITRGGHGSRFVALTAGIEHTIYQVSGSDADLGLLLEGMYDGRSADAPATTFDNDVFTGFRLALNDISDTAILGGPVVDVVTGELIVLVEAGRRIDQSWRVEFEARFFANTAPGSPVGRISQDGFVTLRLSRFF